MSPFHCCNKIPEENRLKREDPCVSGPVVRQNLTAETCGLEEWLTSEPLEAEREEMEEGNRDNVCLPRPHPYFFQLDPIPQGFCHLLYSVLRWQTHWVNPCI